MMKKLMLVLSGGLSGFILGVVLLHTLPMSKHGYIPNLHAAGTAGTRTIKLNNHKQMVCGKAFFDSSYALAKEVFAVGANNVVLSEFEEKAFEFVRHSDSFSGDKEAYIEQIKDLPRQIIEIVKDDPAVLDSCENFQVAMMGPP